MTSTMYVENTPFIAVRDPSVRLLSYLCSLVDWVTRTSVENIIYSDNSLCGGLDTAPLVAFAASYGKRLEVLPFAGNVEAQTFGKGYGEGKSIEDALSRSAILDGDSTFYKVTGRLFIANFDEICRRHCDDPNVISLLAGLPGWLDTRFFKMNVTFFRERLIHTYRGVDDHAGRYIEHVYHDALLGSDLVKPFSLTPIFVGQSGTHGTLYDRDYTADTVAKAVQLRDAMTVKG